MGCIYHYRREFRSQTSDNINRWKSRGGKSQRREEKRREEKRREEKKKEDHTRETVRGKKIQVREKVGKCVFPMICGSGGSKSRLAEAVR